MKETETSRDLIYIHLVNRVGGGGGGGGSNREKEMVLSFCYNFARSVTEV